MSRSRMISVAIILGSFALAGLAFLLPVYGDQVVWMARSRVAVAFVTGGLSFGAAWWFLASLSCFTQKLRNAYRLLVAGVVLFGLALLQFPILGIFNWWDTWYVIWGFMIVPYIVAIAFMYEGLRKFGRLLDIRSRLMSWRVLSVAVVVCIAIFVPIGHFWKLPGAEGIEVYDTVLAWGMASLGFCAVLSGRIERMIGAVYKDAMRWMKITMFGYALATLHEYFAVLLLHPDGPYAATGAEMLPFSVVTLLFLEAGRRFYLITKPVIAGEQGAPLADQDYVDSVITLASLASQPQEVDPILDDLRVITASHQNNQAFSEDERKQLLKVYHKVETYLVTKERVLRLEPADLRRRLRPAFRTLLDQQPTRPTQTANHHRTKSSSMSPQPK